MKTEILKQNQNAKTELLSRLGLDPVEAIMSTPIPALRQGTFRIGGDCLRECLAVLECNSPDGICRLSSNEIAEQMKTRLHRVTVSRALGLMASKQKLVLGTTSERAVAWQQLASLLDPDAYPNRDLPATSYTAFRDATLAKNRLLDKYGATSKTLVQNACFRGTSVYGKWVAADLLRETMLVIDSAGDECRHTVPAIAAAIAARKNWLGAADFAKPHLHRALHALEDSGLVWKREGARQAVRFIRWDCLEPLIPSRARWSDAPQPRAGMVNDILDAKKRLLAQHNVDAARLVDLIELPKLADGGSGRVTSCVQRAVLAYVSRFDLGCKSTLKEISQTVGLDPTSVQRGLLALEGQELITENRLGNQRVMLTRWDRIAPFIREPVVDQTISTETTTARKRLPTLRAVFDRLVRPALLKRNRARATFNEIIRAVDAWEAFWPPRLQNVKKIRRKHLEAWQTHLDGQGLSPSSVNKYLKGISQIMRAAQKHELIATRPTNEQLPTRPAAKFYLQSQEIDKLWDQCDKLTWPQLPGLTPGQWWRCALLLYWIYGFRTQELIAYTVGRRALSWDLIDLSPETPNPEGIATNAFGWFSYTPQKQEWTKPDPLFLPLTQHAKAAVTLLARGRRDGENRLFPFPRGHKQLYSRWRELQVLAGVETKGGSPFELKHIRKSAASHLDRHYRGLAAAVIGWADRDSSAVMTRHYSMNELMVVEQLNSYPVPDCFNSLLSSSISETKNG